MHRALALAVALVVLVPNLAQAHTRSQSFSTWTMGANTVDGIYQVDAYRATQLSETPQDLNKLLRDHLAATVVLSQSGVICAAAPPRAVAAPRGDIRVELRFACPKPFAETPAKLTIGAFFDVSVSHVHYIRMTDASGRSHEAILTEGRTNFDVTVGISQTVSGFADFFLLGFEHVLSGIDHIAFLLALAMLAGGPWRILLAVTGFTLGHSLTLALVALNVLKPETSAVEALIGFTVAWAAGDALARARGSSPWFGVAGAAAIASLPVVGWLFGLPALSWVVCAGLALFAAVMSFARGLDAPYVAPVIATIFGLAHGAGFAGPLLALKIPAANLIVTLLAFNVGVEAGQLTALAGFGALLFMSRSMSNRVPNFAFDALAALLFGLGTFWFVSRALA